MEEKDKLNDMQLKFVEEYMKDFNATQSAIRAGYSEKSARFQASRLLTNANIKEEIEKRKTELREGLQEKFILSALTAQKVMHQILTNKNSSDRDRLLAAKDFLDRAGFIPTQKQEISGKDGGAIEIVFKEPDG